MAGVIKTMEMKQHKRAKLTYESTLVTATNLALDKCPMCEVANNDDSLHRLPNGNYHPGCIRWVTSNDRWQQLEKFAELTSCTCCLEHQTKRPQSLEGGWVESQIGTYRPGFLCDCNCRHEMRKMCRAVQGGVCWKDGK
jgi:hypothetical protein